MPASRAEAVQTGMLVSAPIWVAVWIWAFAVRAAWRAWLGIGSACLVAAALLSLVWFGERL
ncbi:MAG: DUF3649 domain-containing protein [Pseudomonadota bacterium]